MSLAIDTKAETVAQKLLPQLKKPQWNEPDKIELDSSKELIVGRVMNKDHNITGVMLHSSKLPSMLSRRHASIKYDKESKNWTVKDLKSLNGVFVNNKRIDAGVAVPVKNGDVVCFGVKISQNVFKFCLNGNILKRVVCSESDSQEPNSENQDQSQKHSNRVKNHDQSHSVGVSVKNQNQSKRESKLVNNCNQDQSQEKPKTAKRKSSECDTATTKKPRLSQDSVASSSKQEDPQHAKSPAISPCVSRPASLKPSPALSIKSTPEMNMDELFEGCKEETEDTLNEAIFGCTDSKTRTLDNTKLDATTIQIQMAKKAMESEKHKLMSSIAALKSELAAKDQLLAKREEVEKQEKENKSVISSMQEEFTCVICQELFINAYTLPCAHSFCEWCIKEWTKKKKKKDCPICRKNITSDPVHSLVLDNAIEKMVSKMTPKEQEDRKKEELQHKQALKGLAPPPPPKAKTSRAVPPPVRSTTFTVRDGVVFHFGSSSRDHPIVIDDDDDDGSYSSSEDYGATSESSDSSVEGIGYAYYGGYGRCFNCGRRGHWAPGCPYS